MNGMARGLFRRWLVICALGAGCSEPPLSPYIDLGGNAQDIGTVVDSGTPRDATVRDTSVADMNVLADSATADEGTVGPGPGAFDPDRVYIFRWVPYQTTSVPVIEDFDSATQSIPGFEGVTSIQGVIRPSDGRIVFGDLIGVNVFVEDAWSSDEGQPVYPADPDANDTAVSTPQCNSIEVVSVEPDTGAILYECFVCVPGDSSCYGKVFRSGGGEYLAVGATSWWAPGHNGTTLYGQDNALKLRAGGQTTTISTHIAALENVVAVRATPEGFLVVSSEASSLELFLIDTDDAFVSPEGSYPFLAGYDRVSEYRLAANGDLYVIAQAIGNIGPSRVVLRLVVGAVDPALLTSGADYQSALITGP
jgi:hypothetical protein